MEAGVVPAGADVVAAFAVASLAVALDLVAEVEVEH